MKIKWLLLIVVVVCLSWVPVTFARTTTDIRTNQPIEVDDILHVDDNACLSAQYSVPAGHLRQREKGWLGSVLNYAYSYSSVHEFAISENTPIKPVTDKDMRLLVSDSSFTHWAGPELIRTVNDLSSIRRLPQLDGTKDKKLLKTYEDAQRHLINVVREKFAVLEEIANADGCY